MGEAPLQGFPCVILRLAGCNLRCRYCDTPFALVPDPDRTRELTVRQVVDEVRSLGPRLVLLTGGEPMSQDETRGLIEGLLSVGMRVVLETNGAYDLSPVPVQVIKVVDVKCPGSGESGTFLGANLTTLGPKDRLKFVVRDRDDYLWSLGFLREHGLAGKEEPAAGSGGPGILFSPVFGEIDPGLLARWIIDEGIDAQLNLQVHKYIGMP